MIGLALVGCSKSHEPKKGATTNHKPDAANNAPKDVAIAVSKATSTRSNEKNQRVWTISWESANLGIENGKQFGSMVEVKGTTFDNGLEAATFSSRKAEADKSDDRLILEGGVRVESFQKPTAVLTAKKVEWMPKLKVFKASGDVTIESDGGIVGPIDHLFASPKLDKIGTSQEYFKK